MLRKAAQVLVGSYGPRPGDMFFWSDLLGALCFLPAALFVVFAAFGAPMWLLAGVGVPASALAVSWVVALVRRA